jgi:hypothetical protein
MASNKGKKQVSDSAPRIEYSGFKDIEAPDMAQLRTLSEDFANKITSHGVGFTRILIRLKEIHKVEKTQKYEMSVKISGPKVTRSAECTDKNPFKALDLACKKLLVEIAKQR